MVRVEAEPGRGVERLAAVGERRLDRAHKLRRRGSAAEWYWYALAMSPAAEKWYASRRACLLGGPVAHEALDRFPNLPMQLCAPGAREPLVDRFELRAWAKL